MRIPWSFNEYAEGIASTPDMETENERWGIFPVRNKSRKRVTKGEKISEKIWEIVRQSVFIKCEFENIYVNHTNEKWLNFLI